MKGWIFIIVVLAIGYFAGAKFPQIAQNIGVV